MTTSSTDLIRAMREPRPKTIALVAHDNKKRDLLEWAEYNRGTLAGFDLLATGTTGSLLQTQLGMNVRKLLSGPLGGDQQIGAQIAEGSIDVVIFFWDPLEPHPHDVDVKALLRIAVVYNVPIACNRAIADHLISSPLMARRRSTASTCRTTTKEAGDDPPRRSGHLHLARRTATRSLGTLTRLPWPMHGCRPSRGCR